MFKLVALLALLSSSASGTPFGLPATTTTCRVKTIGRSINSLCPTGYTLISKGECCLTAQVSTSGTNMVTSSTTTLRPPFTCVDRPNAQGINECPGWRSYCNDAFYKGYMTHHCPQTCGFCSSTGTTPSTCTDQVNQSTGRSECLANIGLCNNAAFRDWMKIQCPKTCGYCR